MYTIITYKEWELYIWKILENSISSFWNTEKEAYNNTVEALKFYNEDINIKEEIIISSPKIYSLNLSNA